MGIDGGDPNNGWFDDGADVDETKPFICSKISKKNRMWQSLKNVYRIDEPRKNCKKIVI